MSKTSLIARLSVVLNLRVTLCLSAIARFLLHNAIALLYGGVGVLGTFRTFFLCSFPAHIPHSSAKTRFLHKSL